MPDSESTWTVVIPTKRSEVAKSRLEPVLGPWRVRLARAFAFDTIRAVRSCTLVDRIIIVRDGGGLDADPDPPDTHVVADPSHGSDMNAAIEAGLRVARMDGSGPVAVLTADLPALRPEELTEALRRAVHQPVAAVSDTDGVGTTMLASRRPQLLVPRFGDGSFARHLADGARPVPAGPGLARDIDLPEHLADAVNLGVGPSTAALLDETGLA